MISDKDISRLIDDIYFATEPPHSELFCEDANSVILQCAMSGMSDEEAQQAYPALFRHFRLCSDCSNEFNMVMALARLDTLNQLDRPSTIPSAPDIPTVSWMDRVKALKGIIVATIPSFGATNASYASSKTRRLQGKLREETVSLDNNRLNVILTINDSATYEEMRDLVCAFESDDPILIDSLFGSPIWLEETTDGDVIQSLSLNENGTVTFEHLRFGTYILRFTIDQQEYAIEGIEID